MLVLADFAHVVHILVSEVFQCIGKSYLIQEYLVENLMLNSAGTYTAFQFDADQEQGLPLLIWMRTTMAITQMALEDMKAAQDLMKKHESNERFPDLHFICSEEGTKRSRKEVRLDLYNHFAKFVHLHKSGITSSAVGQAGTSGTSTNHRPWKLHQGSQRRRGILGMAQLIEVSMFRYPRVLSSTICRSSLCCHLEVNVMELWLLVSMHCSLISSLSCLHL